ncbi:MAG: radical SAM protein [Deltaproteobacteria bacterium]|nr:radical SAM protein [Deltaproteobacteria bacterium]
MNHLELNGVDGLPAGWTWQAVERRPQGWLLRAQDAQGGEHAFELDESPDERALQRGQRWSVSHRGRVDQADLARTYAAIAQGLLRDEARLQQSLESIVLADVPVPPRHVHWSETELWLRTRGQPRNVAPLLQSLQAPAPLVAELYLESLCGQACQFCQQPGRRQQVHHRGGVLLRDQLRRWRRSLVGSGVFAELAQRLATREPPATLVLTGHDWAADPELPAMLAILMDLPTLGVSLLGPGTALADPGLLDAVVALPNLRSVAFTLQSADMPRHDAQVGAPGAAAKVLVALERLQQRGVPVGVNVVLTAAALPELQGLVDLAVERGFRLNLLGFVPDRGPLDLRPQIPRWDALAVVLAGLSPKGLEKIERLSRVPQCAVPAELRERCDADRSRATRTPPPVCQGCAAATRCAWIADDYRARFGEAGLRPVTAAANPAGSPSESPLGPG